MTKRRIGLIVLFGVILFYAFGTGFAFFFKLLYVMVLLLAVGLVWVWLNLRGLQVQITRLSHRGQVGDYLDYRRTAPNRSCSGSSPAIRSISRQQALFESVERLTIAVVEGHAVGQETKSVLRRPAVGQRLTAQPVAAFEEQLEDLIVELRATSRRTVATLEQGGAGARP